MYVLNKHFGKDFIIEYDLGPVIAMGKLNPIVWLIVCLFDS